MRKYKLPVVVELTQIGFKFKHRTIQEATEYIKEFVKNNRSEIMDIILPGFDGEVYEENLESTDVYTNQESKDIMERISRIKRGFIVHSDYFFVVHPKYKDDENILVKAWKNRLKKYSVDSQLAMYDQTFLGINDDEAIDLVFYNELLRYIILKLPGKKFKAKNDSFDGINNEIYIMRSKFDSYLQNGNPLLFRAGELNYKKLIEAKYELMFSSSESVAQKATRLYGKIQTNKNPWKVIECTTVKEKELVLRHYLKKQTQKVVKSKNTRSTGTHKTKRKKIIHYLKKHPDANNTEVAKALGVNRKTVRKYRII